MMQRAVRIACLLSICVCTPALGQLTDTIEFKDGDIVGDFVGGHDMRRKARVIGAGESFAFDLRVTPNEPLTLEFEEIYGRDTDVRGYLIFVDGVKTALRTFRGCGAGPIHHFVEAPPPAKDRVTVRLTNVGDAPIAIGRVWAFANFDRYFDDARMAVPFHIAPAIRLNLQDTQRDLESLRPIREGLLDRPSARPAFTTWIAYAVWSDDEVARQIDYLFELAERAQMPVQICFDTWWASTPVVPDGRGGFFNDIQYQQVVYNATKKRMELSTPNRWGNMPWLSPSHPDLLAYKTRKLAAAGKLLRARYQRLRSRKKEHLLLAINLDNEPVYWASGNAGLGMDLLQADFNPHTIAAAKRAGVMLDPVDGLSTDERRWLWRNLLDYNETIARTLTDSLGRGAGVDVYTQAMVADPALQYPLFDGARPFWECAAPVSARVGGEWNADSQPELDAVLHQLSLGRNAAANAECSDDPAMLRAVAPAFALGQRYLAPYNYPFDKLHLMADELGDGDREFEPFVHRPILLEHHFADDNWKKIVAAHEHVTVDRIGNSPAMAVRCVSSSKTGSLTYRLRAKGERFDGLAIELSGRALDFAKTNDAVAIRVLAGDDDASLQPAGEIRGQPDINVVHRIDLTSIAKGKREVVVRMELHPGGIAQLPWCSVHRVRFTTPWSVDAPPSAKSSLSAARRRHLLISWRRDAELAMEQLPSPDAQAHVAFDRGEYAQAYAIANRVLAEMDSNRGVGEQLTQPRRRSLAGVLRRLRGRLAVMPDDATGAAPLRIDDRTRITRRGDAAAVSALRMGDHIDVTLRDDGSAESIAAIFGEAVGVIEELKQLTPYQMPAIRLRDDPDLRVVDLAAPLHLSADGNPITFKSNSPGATPLAARERVRIRFNPKSGRVHELWKLN